MFNMKDLQRITRYSRDQLRDRLRLLGAIVEQDSQRGPRNSLLLGDTTLAALRRMRELENGERGPQEAAGVILEELGRTGNYDRSEASTVPPVSPKLTPGLPGRGDSRVEILERLVKEKERRIADLGVERDHWRDLALDYRRQLAPPKDQPKNRRKWLGWLRPSTAR